MRKSNKQKKKTGVSDEIKAEKHKAKFHKQITKIITARALISDEEGLNIYLVGATEANGNFDITYTE